MPEWGTIASLLLALGALITALSSRRKSDVDADVSLAKQAMEMVKEVRLDVERLKAENRQLQIENGKLRDDLDAMETRMEIKDQQIERLLAGVSVLCTQVKALGQEPMFRSSVKGKGGV